MKTKILAAIAVLALLVGWWQPWNDGADRTPALALDEEPVGESVHDRDPAAPAPDSAPVSERVAVPSAVEEETVSSALLGGRFEFEVEGTLFDQHDEPVAGAEIQLADPLGPWNVIAETDQRGRFRLRFRAHQRRLDLLLRIQGANARGEGFRRCTLDAGRTELRLGLRVTGGPQIVYLNSDSAGSDPPGARGSLSIIQFRVESGEDGSYSLLNDVVRGSSISPPSQCEIDDRGFLCLTWPTTESLQREPDFVQTATASTAFTINLTASGTLIQFASQHEEEGPPKTLVEGTLIRPDGSPAAGARLVAFRSGERTVHEANAEGGFSFEAEPGAELLLKGGGGEDGIASETFDLRSDPAPPQVRWDVRLDRGAEISGTLVDDAGQPLAGRLVEVQIDTYTGVWSDTSITGEDGSFSLPNLPTGAAQLFLRSDERALFAAQVVTGTPVGGMPEHLQFGAADEAVGGLEGRLVDSQGNPVPDAEVRIVQVETGRGAWLQAGEEGHYLAESLPPGAWRVSAGNRSRGWIDLGVARVTAGAVSGLGLVLVPDPLPARLELLPDPELEDPPRWALLRRGHSLDSVVWDRVPEEGLDDALPRGSYVELRVDPDGERAQREFEVR